VEGSSTEGNDLSGLSRGRDLGEIHLWRRKEDFVLRKEDLGKNVFNETLLYQLMSFDRNTFLLVVATSERQRGKAGYTFNDLVDAVSGYFVYPRKVVSNGLDTLLDCAIYKPEWVMKNGYWQRTYYNRSELVSNYYAYRNKLFDSVDPFSLSRNQAKTIERLYADTLIRPADKFSHTISIDQRKNRIEQDITTFIDKYLKPEYVKHEPAIIVPTMRKGAILLRHLRRKAKLDGFEIEYGYYLRKNKLRGKHVILFDDAVQKGNVLKEYKELLVRDLGISEERIITAAYCVNVQTCPENVKSEIKIGPMKPLDADDFRREVSDIMLYIASFGEIIDPDHLMIGANYKVPQPVTNVVKSLEELGIGEILEPDLDHLYAGRKKITLNLGGEGYNALTGEDLPQEVKSIDICKVRFLFEYSKDTDCLSTKEFNMVPVVNAKIPELSESQANAVLERYGFMEIESGQEETYGTPQYVDAITYQLVTSLIKGFLRMYVEKTKGDSEMTIRSAEWNYLSAKYPHFGMLMDRFMHQLLQYAQSAG
jgi:hypothetical protein